MSYFAVEQSLPALIGRWVTLKRGGMLRDFRLRFYLVSRRMPNPRHLMLAGSGVAGAKMENLRDFERILTVPLLVSYVFWILEGQVLPSSDPE